MQHVLPLKNFVLHQSDSKPLVVDFFPVKNSNALPVVYCHGLNGFKDWGAANLIAEAFQRAGIPFVKFNFSHNGGTPEQPVDFPDLESYGRNTYSKELQDICALLDFLEQEPHRIGSPVFTGATLLGHSRGGGMCILAAKEDRVKHLITWASVSDLGKRLEAYGLEQWKSNGVFYRMNQRTKQRMPVYYDLYKDYIAQPEKFDIQRACSVLKKPHLIVHGTADSTVEYAEAEQLKSWNSQAILLPIEGANHTFGAAHPWDKESLPDHLKQVVATSIDFLLR